jgi:hypothetical protein
MVRRRIVVGICGVFLALGFGAAVAVAAESEGEEAPTEPVLELPELEVRSGDDGELEVEPQVDCSDGRPDEDCLSGRLGSDQVNQQCAGIAVMFGAGSCSVHCREGYYACGKCGFGGFAMCTCRENFSCHPHAP